MLQAVIRGAQTAWNEPSDGRPTGLLLSKAGPSRRARGRGRPRGPRDPRGRRSAGAGRPARGRPPSVARLSMTLVTPPRRGRVHDQPRRGLDPARGLAVGDVEGEEAAEARVAHGLDPGWPRSRSASRAAVAVWRATRTSSVFRPRSRSQRGSGAATMPVTVRKRRSSSAAVLVPADDRAEQGVVVAGEVLRRAVQRRSRRRARAAAGAPASRRSSRRRRGRDARPRLRGRASSGTGSTAPRARRAARRRAAAPVWSNSTQRRPQRSSVLEGDARAEVAALGERDRVARLQQREHERRRRAGCPTGRAARAPPSSSPSARSASATVGLP